MMAYPDLTEPQGAQRVLPLFDCGKSLHRNRPPILDARREASGSRFVPNPKARAPGQFADFGFGELRVEQWRGHAMPAGSSLSGTEVTLIINIHAVGSGLKTVFPREVRHGLKKLILAMKATTGIVKNVLRPLHLCGVNDFQRN